MSSSSIGRQMVLKSKVIVPQASTEEKTRTSTTTTDCIRRKCQREIKGRRMDPTSKAMIGQGQGEAPRQLHRLPFLIFILCTCLEEEEA